MFLGLRTVVYPTTDLTSSKAWFAGVLGVDAYFDQPFYVGFDVGGYELGLVPAGAPDAVATTYWGVPDADAGFARLLAAGATPHQPVTDVGDGIRLGAVTTPDGAVIGVIENPHFVVKEPATDPTLGPGR